MMVQTTRALCISIGRHDSLVRRTSGSNNDCDILNSNGVDSFTGECEVRLPLCDDIFWSKEPMTLSFNLAVQET